MYFINVNSLLKNNSLVGKKVFGIKVKEKYSLNIDSKKDIILAKHYFNIKIGKKKISKMNHAL